MQAGKGSSVSSISRKLVTIGAASTVGTRGTDRFVLATSTPSIDYLVQATTAPSLVHSCPPPEHLLGWPLALPWLAAGA